jgi:hypothetical protein
MPMIVVIPVVHRKSFESASSDFGHGFSAARCRNAGQVSQSACVERISAGNDCNASRFIRSISE